MSALLDLRLWCESVVVENPYRVSSSIVEIWRYVKGDSYEHASKKSL